MAYLPVKTNFAIIKEHLAQFLTAKNLKVPIVIEEPKLISRGHYSTNIALLLSKKMKASPMIIGQEIKTFLSKGQTNFFAKIGVVAPGFINLWLTNQAQKQVINNVLTAGDNYGRGLNQRYKYNLEIVSANPTGLLHIGHARNGVIGDSVARILKFIGYQVTVEHYTNDAGNQINILAVTILISYLKICGINKPLPAGCYQGDFYTPPAQTVYQQYGRAFCEVSYSDDLILDSSVNAVFKQVGVKYFLQKIKDHLKLININVDYYISEAAMYKQQLVDYVLEKYATNHQSYQKDGALWLTTAQYGDSKDRVIIKSDQTATYLLPDVASHYNKIIRTHPDKMVDFWGGDHHSYIKRMQIGLKLLGVPDDTLEVDMISMVRLTKDGVEMKMSKRKGTAIWLIDLYQQFGLNALRYMLARKAGSSPMDLNMDLLEEQSANNPVFYIQYATARSHSLLKKAQENSVFKNFKTATGFDQISPEATRLINKLDWLPYTIKNAGAQRAPHILCDYLYDLAKRFHSYYNNHQILNVENIALSQQHLQLVLAVYQLLCLGVKLLGMKVINQM